MITQIKTKLDLSAIVTMSMYSVCIGVRMMQWIILIIWESEQHNAIVFALRLMNSFTERFKWFILYFFIFEMQEVRIKLASQSAIHYKGLM